MLFISLLAVDLAIVIVSLSQNYTEQPQEAAIVLGAATWQDQPSPVFQARIDHAINLYQREIIKKILFTGGLNEGKTHAESVTAKNYALNRGVPHTDILIETTSTTTIENYITPISYYYNTIYKAHYSSVTHYI